ncbi:NACHT domain-containing protein [Solimonas sp. K1W22B-7]|uniref:NACHT domain-containing protein n=1 Tax=Solimonas sp. K1W22B-7 TaxID=2303331 RepID=UPI000E337A9A|nr:NACHT domain-containing protein [Solimonas sp. K1W22B-7]AXQ27876.1 NACHT domain-containing protein [Solimonas sp. K1W22B-7]
MESLVAIAKSAAVTAAIEKSIEKAYDFISSKYQLNRTDNSKSQTFRKQYIKYCVDLLSVKTLASPNETIFINDIYVPLNLRGIKSFSVLVTDDVTLDLEERTVFIKGLAGQGKSTLLRKLIANNAIKNNRFPLFYELKNYKGGTLESQIAEKLTRSGLTIDEETVQIVLKDSEVKVYLDAFDETPTQFREELVEEIRKIIAKYNCNLVVTTRPDTELDSVTQGHIYEVCELNEDQIFSIIKKTASDTQKADELIQALSRTHLHKQSDSVLKSPILVVLFCISYNLGEEIPSTLSQFYENIFETIFFRHDNLKGRVNRTRHWNDNRRIYRQVFEGLCFFTQKMRGSSFTRLHLTEGLSKALLYVNEDEKLSDRILDELSGITNLIIEDGFNEYRFVHKSVQEFFTASFVRFLGSNEKSIFYKSCWQSHQHYSTFNNTLFFLEDLDYYAHAEYYLLPTVRAVFGEQNFDLSHNLHIPDSVLSLFLDQTVKAKVSRVKGSSSGRQSTYSEYQGPRFEKSADMAESYTRLFNMANSVLDLGMSEFSLALLVVEKGRRGIDGFHISTLGELLKAADASTDVASSAIAQAAAVLFARKYTSALSKVQKRSSLVSDGNLLGL